MEMMLQSLWRKGQQQWRNSNSSKLVDCSNKFCEKTMRDYCANNFGVKLTYVCRPYVGQNWKRAGARQFFYPYSSTQEVRMNPNLKQQISHKCSHKQHKNTLSLSQP